MLRQVLIYLVTALGFIIVYAVTDTKGMVKLVMMIFTALAVLRAAVCDLGIGVSVALGLNGIFAPITITAVKDLVINIRLEKNGILTTATVVDISYSGRGESYIIDYTDKNGEHHMEKTYFSSSEKVGKGYTFDILCDADSPKDFCVKDVSLRESRISCAVVCTLQAVVLGLTISFMVGLL